jgi:hypothetical protein
MQIRTKNRLERFLAICFISFFFRSGAMKRVRQAAWVIGVSLVLATVSAQAALITATSVTDNNGVGEAAASQASDGYTGDDHKWYTIAPNASGDFFAAATATPVLTFDLGANRSVNALALWNYNISGNGAKNFSVAYSTDNVNFSNIGNFTTAVPSVARLGEDANTKYVAVRSPIPEEDFSFGSAVSARYFQVTFTDNWCGGTCQDSSACIGGDRVGIHEIQFNSVPEPSTVVLFVTGLIGLSVYAWRKQK